MLLCLFEDAAVAHLRPLVDTRPVYDLRLGIRTPLEAARAHLPASGLLLHSRAYIAAATREAHDVPVNYFPAGTGILFVNGRLALGPGAFVDTLRRLASGPARMLVQHGTVVAAWLPAVPESFTLPDAVTPEAFDHLPTEEVTDAPLFATIPDLIHDVRAAITRDFDAIMQGVRQIERSGTVHPGAHLVEPDRIFLGDDSRVHAGAVLDASDGPIYLDAGAIVFPNTVVKGPVYLGPGSQLKALASVEGTAIGPGCKIGGEVHTTIVQAYSNKGHQGFVGHTYVGEWCNFGADTNTSNLRNDYGTVSLYDYAAGDFIQTGRQFMGLVFGDHSKCAIDTTFNTGTVVGVGSNLYGAGFHDRFVPAFSWGEPGAYAPYRLDKFMQVAEAVMARRNQALPSAQRDLLTFLHAQSR